ncbi:hypothetical protein P3X46_012341 [Hevea brasiliensis]|uniref:Retropepsins domain-containing protein n=1 Tax=Hevea brasiliensis TaxID=3981 RepID=A0ABQ9M9Z8_HEVBR|nr:hypothetical protein P3X46_012341 [Hevea brasiliensis]
MINVIAGGLDGYKTKGKKVAKTTSMKNVLSVDRESLYIVCRVLTDTGSLVNLITLEVYEKIELKRSNLIKVMFPLVGLGDKIVPIVGTTNLIMTLGDEAFKRSIYAKFTIMDIPLSYNVILGRAILNSNNILINMDYLFMKLLALGGITVLRGSQKLAQECYKQSIKVVVNVTLLINLLEKPDSNISLKPVDPVQKVELSKGKIVRIGTTFQI